MSTRLRRAAVLLVPFLWLLAPAPASAARVLFVSDDGSDTAIVDVLRGDGHDVTSVERDFAAGLNPSFHPDLSGYDCVVWSASTDDSGTRHTDAMAFANLFDFASSGGSVFVTGFGSVSAMDTRLLDLLGASGAMRNTGLPGTVVDLDSDLTTGVVDIRTVTPSSFGRNSYEALTGLTDETTLIVPAQSSATAAQWAIRAVGTGHIAWVAGLEDTNVEWTPTDAGPGGAFNAAVRNFVTASTGTASVPGAPRVGFSTPFSALEGAALMVSARVTDPEGDTVTFSWDLDGDGHYGQEANNPMVVIPAGTTDGPNSFLVGVEASDGVHTSHRSRSIAITNVAPVITSHPPTVAAIDQHVRYMLAVTDPGGVLDPLAFDLRTGPTSAFLTPDGLLDWTPTAAEITAPGTTRSVVIDVDDGDGGTVTQMWSMVVLADHAPSDPTLLYPVMDAPVLIAGLRLSVGNASDLDGDPVSYTLEIASSPAFDADLQTSGPQPGSPTGITEWSPDTSALHFGHWYWRASASDGEVSTAPISASFLLVPDPSTFPDVGLADAGPDAGVPPDMARGCTCSIGARDRSFAAISALSALITLALARRRRR